MFEFIGCWFLLGVLTSMFMGGARDVSFSRADQALDDVEQFDFFNQR